MTNLNWIVWRRRASVVLLGIGLLAGSVLPARAQEGPSIEKQPQISRCYVSKLTFHLPLNMSDMAKSHYKEVHLYCKDTPSAAWTLLDKAPPTQSGFNFKANKEGEYWFTMTTIDQAGNASPADPDQSTFRLVVVVDMQAPVIDLQTVGTGPEGQVVQLDLRDANIDPAKTLVLYQTKDLVWRPLEAQGAKKNCYLIPAQAATTGMLKVEAADLAANYASREFNLNDSAAAPSVNPQLPLASVQTKPSVDDSLPPPSAASGDPAKDNFVNPDQGLKTASFTKMPAQEIKQEIAPKEIVTPVTPTPVLDNVRPAPINNIGGIQVGSNSSPSLTSKEPCHLPNNALPGQTPKEACPLPPTGPLPGQPVMVPGQPATFSTSSGSLGSSVNRQLINRLQLLLEYKLEQVGVSGVGKVEVWITRDTGKTWAKLREDKGCISPLTVELPGEGLFGITLVVSNGRGFGGVAPKPGDAPDAWIEVDTTRPTAEFTSVHHGLGDDSGVVLIQWSAKDRNLHADSVELYYSSSRDGSWQLVSKNLKNEGSTRWVPPVSFGPNAFFRLVVRDMAGNTTVVETPTAIAVDDLSRPRGRLVGIVPLTPEIRLDPMGN